jgi:hypothetical protein
MSRQLARYFQLLFHITLQACNSVVRLSDPRNVKFCEMDLEETGEEESVVCLEELRKTDSQDHH